MLIDFTKMHGAGNDFVFIEDMHAKIELSKEDVLFLCDRHFGIGADGVILVRPPKTDDGVAYMHYINSDGSLAQMCGNGIRCFARYLVDNRMILPDEDRFVVDTLSGPKSISIIRGGDGEMEGACVDMGVPAFTQESLPTLIDYTGVDERYGSVIEDAPVAYGAGTLDVTCVSMGNPHAVVFIDEDPGDYDVIGIGSMMEGNDMFPQRTNVEFARVMSSDDGVASISMRVFERGCGETLACGTGCCATAVAAALTGRTGRSAIIHVLGGDIAVDWREDDHVYMSGPAVKVFDGRIELPSIVISRNCCNCSL